MGRKYPVVTEGQWIPPVRRNYRMRCCDCGLVHKINFKLIPYGSGKKIIFQAFRDERATAACRRQKNKS